MFSLCKQTHPATAVEHAVSCHFYNRAEKDLVVAGANIIRVFQLIPDVDVSSKNKLQDGKPPKMKLECVSQFTLFGNVMSMQSVTLNNSERDGLLLSFKEAKVSIVQYDLDTHDLKTLSLHYFEEEEMKIGWSSHWQIPIIRVDPQNRCAVLLAYGRQIVVLPFRRGSLIDDPNSKEQVLASYTIPIRNIEAKLDNIIDIQFLHGYYEPTLLILYESIRTFPGRIAVRKDTCSMVSVSLNIQQKVYPVIWSVSNLPFDCIQALPVSKPLGGSLILTNNALIYLNQSVPPYGVSLNPTTDHSTSFPLSPQEGISMCLEGAQCAFISTDKLVISLKGGELYVLTLLADSIHSMRRFHFEKAAASVLTTCICVCGDNYLFLGSRLGNSLLLRFTVKEKSDAEKSSEDKSLEEAPAAKKKKMDTLTDWMASNVADLNDDELEVYGSQQQTDVEITSFVFEVCDSLINIGPCGNITMGEPAFLSEEFTNTTEPDIELVTTSGHGKNGALCILQRSIRPQIVTTFELPGCTNMWTVVGDTADDLNHSFMILSQIDSTMVLQTGREINELDSSGFTTHCPTVFSGNIGSNKFIIQVTAMTVHLLQGAELVQTVALEIESNVIEASVADPHLFLLTQGGEILHIIFKESKQGVGRLIIKTLPTMFHNTPLITNISVYRDISGLFTTTLSESERLLLGDKENFAESLRGNIDEDELLYGDSGKSEVLLATPSQLSELHSHVLNKDQPVSTTPWWYKYLNERKPSYWLFLTRDNGNLEVYSLVDFKLVFLVPNIGHGPRILSDHVGLNIDETNDTPSGNKEFIVHELLTVSLGLHGNRTLLLFRTQNELLVYQAFRHPIGNIKLRFKKLQTIFTSDRSKKSSVEPGIPPGIRISKMRYFNNVAGYNGVFISGEHPHWLFLTSRGELRVHPMSIDGQITCFASFHNVNCPQGFLYFNNKSELRIAVLPIHLAYDAPWPVRKVPLKCTPHFVVYHLETKTYCVVLSSAEPSNTYFRFNGEDKELVTENRDPRFVSPLVDQFRMVLFSPFNWEEIPNTNLPLEPWEHVLCLKNVSLEYEGTTSGLRGYICIGTNYNYSEDITCRGRILLFDIIEVVPEPGQPLTKNKIKMIYAKEQKGPVSAISHVSGFLVTAVGQKIYIWELKNNDLTGIAFIDTEIYIHQMLTMKNLILVGDVYRSISLLRFQEEFRTLSLVGRDYKPTQVYACEFLLESSSMGFLLSDKDQNIVMFMYQPEARESNGGHRLMRKADFHLGQNINSFFKIRCKSSSMLDSQNSKLKFMTCFATLDGGVGYILPIQEKQYRRLLMLQNVLVTHTSHTAGLNPRSYRTYKGKGYYATNPVRGIIDGELVWHFMQLSLSERLEVCKKIGSKHNDLLDELYQIETLTSHF